MVLVRHPLSKWHTVVVDAIGGGRVQIRDPWPPQLGSAYALPTRGFAAIWTGAAVVFPKR